MAIVFNDYQVPLAPDHPLPSTRYHAEDFNYSLRVYHDSDWGDYRNRPFVLYFHGSGATAPLTGPLLDQLIAVGYSVFATMYFGAWNSSVNPFRYGYGNVNSPHFNSSFIKQAWWVKSAIHYITTVLSTDEPITILGHSMGAAASLAYTSNHIGDEVFSPRIKGVVSSGATIAGLGTGAWNDVMRNINTLSGIIGRLKLRTVVAAGSIDAYGPPDYQRRLQMAYREGSEVYFVTPGNFGHGWTNEPASAHFAVNWVNQITQELPILTHTNKPAIVGLAQGD